MENQLFLQQNFQKTRNTLKTFQKPLQIYNMIFKSLCALVLYTYIYCILLTVQFSCFSEA